MEKLCSKFGEARPINHVTILSTDVVQFDTYRNLQRHRAVLPAIARLLFHKLQESYKLCTLKQRPTPMAYFGFAEWGHGVWGTEVPQKLRPFCKLICSLNFDILENENAMRHDTILLAYWPIKIRQRRIRLSESKMQAAHCAITGTAGEPKVLSVATNAEK